MQPTCGLCNLPISYDPDPKRAMWERRWNIHWSCREKAFTTIDFMTLPVHPQVDPRDLVPLVQDNEMGISHPLPADSPMRGVSLPNLNRLMR